MSIERYKINVVTRKIILSFALVFTTTFFASAANCVWVGTTSNWATASNWSTNTVPGSGDNVFIGTAAFANQPVISSIVAAISNLTFGSSGPITLTITSGFTLTVNNTITQNHNSNYGGSTTNIVGTKVAGVLGGSITCANFVVGDNTNPPTPSALSIGLANVT